MKAESRSATPQRGSELEFGPAEDRKYPEASRDGMRRLLDTRFKVLAWATARRSACRAVQAARLASLSHNL
jgi:hypothetical protein